MKFSIGQRLFVAVMLCFLGVGGLGMGLARWSFSKQASSPSTQDDSQRLLALSRWVADQFRGHGDWSFLPRDAARRQAWLGDGLAQLPAQAGASAAPGLVDRIGLRDAQGRLLAGHAPHALLVALASVDTIERPVQLDGRRIGSVLIARAENPDDDLAVAFLIAQQRRLAWLALIGLGLAALASAALAAHFRRPVRQLVAGARRLGAGQVDTRLAMRRSDELGELAQVFDQLAARLAQAEQSRRQWVADTSHELRTPLSVLRAQLESLQDGLREPTPGHLARMHRQLAALEQLVSELHALAQADARPLPGVPAPVDAWQLADEVLQDFAGPLAQAKLVATLGAPPATAVVLGDAERLRQVLRNLLENSVRYTHADGRIGWSAEVQDAALHLRLDDSAPGVPADALPRLGERFFRVEASRSRAHGGAGLGLALCRQIAEAHGGQLRFGASPLGGLRATLILPLAP